MSTTIYHFLLQKANSMKRLPDVKRVTLSARLPKTLVNDFKKLAVSENRSASSMVEFLIKQALNNIISAN